MGTETPFPLTCVQFVTFLRVKLNNPLMGTETWSIFFGFFGYHLIVKLNNPLMGTETTVVKERKGGIGSTS